MFSCPFVVLIGAVFFLVSSAVAGEPAAPAFVSLLNAAQPTPVVVCFGDSVTGVYYHTGGRRAYTDMVAIALEQEYPGTTVSAINAGISSNTTEDALSRIDRDVLAHQPDLVTIMFGLNDMTRVPLDAYEQNLVTIIQKCRTAGAEVLLCTPNSLRNTNDRPIDKLEEYMAVVRAVAISEQTPLVDCYRAFESVRERDELDWAFLMSDDIHPNMDGHKRIAEEIVGAISGAPVSLADIGPIPLAIPHTIELLRDGNPIRVAAMPPYDTLIPSALQALWPDAQVTVTTWPVDGQSLAEIEAHSKGIRAAKPDLVFVAVPVEAEAESTGAFIERFSWVLNNSISFGTSEWDCVAAPPSLLDPHLAGEHLERDRDMQRLIRAQDLGAVERSDSGVENVDAILKQWLTNQLAVYEREQ